MYEDRNHMHIRFNCSKCQFHAEMSLDVTDSEAKEGYEKLRELTNLHSGWQAILNNFKKYTESN